MADAAVGALAHALAEAPAPLPTRDSTTTTAGVASAASQSVAAAAAASAGAKRPLEPATGPAGGSASGKLGSPSASRDEGNKRTRKASSRLIEAETDEAATTSVPAASPPSVQSKKSAHRVKMSDVAIPEAPLFRPSEDEFADPIEYIKSIRKTGEQYGIVKIVPPAGWSLPCTVAEREASPAIYITRRQRINKLMEGHAFPDGREYTFKGYKEASNRFKQLLWPSLMPPGTPAYPELPMPSGPRIDQMVASTKELVERARLPPVRPEGETYADSDTPMSPYARIADRIEGMYWALVEGMDDGRPASDIFVEYANDNDTRLVGSLFPLRQELVGRNAALPADVISASSGHNTPVVVATSSSANSAAGVAAGSSGSNSNSSAETTPLASPPGGGGGVSSSNSSAAPASTPANGGVTAASQAAAAAEYSLHHRTAFVRPENGLPARVPCSGRFSDPAFYAETGWNLNNLPHVSNSVLRHVREEVNGLNVPWLYCGQLFSSFCWHNEDHYTYSVNYMGWGEGKTWYGVPAEYAADFESVLFDVAAEQDASFDRSKPDKDLLFQILYMIPPSRLQAAGIQVCRTFQEPGQFIVTFPQAYHSGFSHGLNIAEAVNFATTDWLGAGRKAVERYRTSGSVERAMCFSHEALLLDLARHVGDHPKSDWDGIARELHKMVAQEEREREKAVREHGITLQVALKNEGDPRYECVRCRNICYLSAVICRCAVAKRKVACLRHPSYLCGCAPSQMMMVHWHSMGDIRALADGVAQAAVT